MRVFLVLIFFVTTATQAQNSTDVHQTYTTVKHKPQFYFYWGYNRSWFAKSDLRISGPDYDFKLYDIKATDRPSPVNLSYLNPTEISIPQFNIRLGYFINKHVSLSLGYDHMKYVMTQYQEVKISGNISLEASDKYGGQYTNQLVKLTPDFLRFEHTNGFNYISADAEYQMPLFSYFNNKIRIELQSGLGGGFFLPKTDVSVFGYGADNKFHIAGWGFHLKTGPEIQFGKHFFLLTQAKTGWSILPDILIKNDAPERARQQIGYMEFYITGGINFGL